MKKLTALVLAFALLLVLVGCGSKSKEGGRMIFDHEDAGTHVEGTAIDVQKVYDTMTYTPHMFFGWYQLSGQTEEEFGADMEYMSVSYRGEDASVSVLPYGWRAGAGTMLHKINSCTEYSWGEFHFRSESGNLYTMICAVTIESGALCLYPLETYHYDEATDSVTYTLPAEPLRYAFSFAGPNVTLSTGNLSVTVRADDFCEDNALVIWNYLSAGSACLDGIEEIDLYSFDGEESYERFTLVLKNGETVRNTTGYVTEDGLFSYSWTDEAGKAYSGQYVYFWCGDDGLILSDGATNYYYLDSFWAHYENLLQANVDEEDLEIIEAMPDSQVEEIETKRTSLFEDLSAAFTEAGLDIHVDAATGEIMLDSAVLFDTSSAELREEGKEFLNTFLQVYTSVLYGEEYDGFVKRVIVEGHADPRGNAEENQTLSEARAASVMSWCAAGENGLSADMISVLTANMVSVGYSSDYPIYDENGEIDNDASRRVSFRFIINIG